PRLRTRPPPGRAVLHPLPAVPGEPDQPRLAPAAERRPPRRHGADPADPPKPDRLSLMDLVLRAIFVFGFILLLTRVIGKRELGSLQPFDLVLLIILGDALQQGLTQDDYSLTGAVLVVGTIAVLQVGVSWVSFRFPRVRPILEGEPVVIVQDGKVIERNLQRERLTVQEVTEAARKQQIAHLAEVRWAVLETSGEISFIKTSG